MVSCGVRQVGQFQYQVCGTSEGDHTWQCGVCHKKENSVYAPDPKEKFDYQNMDVKLYLALKALVQPYTDQPELSPTSEIVDAQRAMYEFEQSFGPIPDWAIARNFGYELLEGAQLYTRDGRRHGNGWIVNVLTGAELQTRYQLLTDAGSTMAFTETELLEAFSLGDWISTRQRVIDRFDHDGIFR